MYFALMITKHLAVVACPDLVLNDLERIIFRFLWKGGNPLVWRYIYGQNPAMSRLVTPWLIMRKYALKLKFIFIVLDQEYVWSLPMKIHLPQLNSLIIVGSSVEKNPKQKQCKNHLKDNG